MDHGLSVDLGIDDLISGALTEHRVQTKRLRLKLLACYKTMDIFA